MFKELDGKEGRGQASLGDDRSK
jgi:hypothetical protein